MTLRGPPGRPCIHRRPVANCEQPAIAAEIRASISVGREVVLVWHENLGEATIADAILDRLLASAHRIELRGESMRRAEPAKSSARDETLADGR